jgi:hypothetical protein
MLPEQPDSLLPRRRCAEELGVSVRSIKRYEDLKLLGFTEWVKLNGRTFHPRSAIEAVKKMGIALPKKGA